MPQSACYQELLIWNAIDQHLLHSLRFKVSLLPRKIIVPSQKIVSKIFSVNKYIGVLKL